MTAPTRPIIRYHGGKWRIAPWIVEHLPPHRMYVEPFGGAASVLMRKPRAPFEVYNDLDDEIVNLFRVLRDPDTAAQLRQLIELTPYSRVELRAAYGSTEDPVERARLTVVRASMGYGSAAATRGHRTGFRVQRGGRTSPASDFATWPAQVPAIVERLRGVVIECRPALECVLRFEQPDTLIYVDPPYVHDTRCDVSANKYYRHEMSDAEHESLLLALRASPAMVVVSGYRSPLYDDLLGDWHRLDTVAWASGRVSSVRRTECLWLNAPAIAAGALHNSLQFNSPAPRLS